MKKSIMTSAFFITVAYASLVSVSSAQVAKEKADQQEVKQEHALVGNHTNTPNNRHTRHPDAQWFPDAGLGLFLHWDPASVKPIGISLSMVPGRKLVGKKITQEEFKRIVEERDFNLDGKPFPITPNEYWALAKDFNPENYHPEVWLKKVRDAGFTYAVLTTKHCNGFAMWPSAYGEFNTKKYMGGRDLVKDYAEACRQVGLRVGLYYSPVDFYYDQEFRSFLYFMAKRENPGLPPLDADLKIRKLSHTPNEIKAYHKGYAELVRGQVEELLTNYGTIDLIWFDGRAPVPGGNNIISLERIRELQPGIVVNTRMHGKGDYITPERVLPDELRLKSDEWGEFCTPWNYWSYSKIPFRPLNEVLTELIRSRNAGVNYLIGFGPMPDGDLAPEAYENMEKLGEWMKINGEAIYNTRALPEGESASVLASSKGDARYLYLLPENDQDRAHVSFTGFPGDYRAQLLGDGRELEVVRSGDTQTIDILDDRIKGTVKVIKLTLKNSNSK